MDWLSAAMVLNGVPSVLLSTQEGVLYSSRCIETVYESLKVYLYNRSRQRARIEYLLQEWSILQVEATAVDERFTTEMNIPVRLATSMRKERIKLTRVGAESGLSAILHRLVPGGVGPAHDSIRGAGTGARAVRALGARDDLLVRVELC
jgi:hypothetical protein